METWKRKAIECSKLDELFCGNSEDRNVESNTDDADLVCNTSEGSKGSTGPLCEESGVSSQKEIKTAVIIRNQKQ